MLRRWPAVVLARSASSSSLPLGGGCGSAAHETGPTLLEGRKGWLALVMEIDDRELAERRQPLHRRTCKARVFPSKKWDRLSKIVSRDGAELIRGALLNDCVGARVVATLHVGRRERHGDVARALGGR